MDVDQEENDHSSQVAMTVEVINLESDEDEDLPMVQDKPEGKVMHLPRAMNARSESASPATLHAQGGMNGVVLPEPAPPTMNGVPQSEQLQPAPATVSGVVSPAQHEPALAPMNGILHLEQRRPEPVHAAKDRVPPQALLWHYVDPQGDTRGPFPLLLLRQWKQYGYFSEDFRVWRTGQVAEQAILLNDAFQMHL